MDNVSQQPPDQNLNQQPQQTSTSPKPQQWIRIIILLSLFILILVTIIVVYVFKTNEEPSSQNLQTFTATPTQSFQKNNYSTYKNPYWGFEVIYPKNWFLWESKSGDTTYIASYDGKDINTWYTPRQDQLRIDIFAIPKDMGSDFIRSHPDDIIKQNEGTLIGGERSKEVYKKIPLSNYEIAQQQSHNIPQSQIDRGRYIVLYATRHNNFTYTISAEPADSNLINEFKQLLANFKFIPRIEYKPIADLPSKGTAIYQDTRLGYSFEYPENLVFTPPEISAGGFENTSIIVQFADNINADSGVFEKDIVHFVSLICDADGVGSSIYCPEEDIKLEPFMSKYGASAYKIRRKRVHKTYIESGKTGISSILETLIAYKIKSPEYFGIVFYAGLPEEEQEMIEIANSFRYLELKNR